MAYDFSRLDSSIKESEEWLARELSGIRTGRATPMLLDGVKPDAYGTRTPIAQIASVTIEDARTLRIVPWDKSLTKHIEKAVVDADLGVGVGADDQGLRISFPELTAERRTMLTKLAKDKLEQARITLRGHRTDAIKDIEAAEKEGGMGKDDVARLKEEVQKKIDAGIDALEAIYKRKETEIAS
ncbi:MAG TPA: ribosome recycling factor [Candidatus Paceibacterota bacterium]|nr:ribosome recycling factor [Candidatus Paceibacterota bacterium]